MASVDFAAVAERLGISSLRPFQKECIENVMKQRDVFVCSPTGSGKSVCFTGLVAHYKLASKGCTIVVVSSPNLSTLLEHEPINY